ncbi:hypothetical protein BT93_H1792 [Corymbia citriodora subsp. variegata]|nr:hypothetical protein BT93_H1792 [Corymbia citriodora subsp. variegata]
MVSARSSALVALMVAATTALLLTQQADAGRVLTGDLCKNTDFPALCSSMVKSKVNAEKATKSAINNIILKTREAKLSTSMTKGDKSLLDVCNEMYDTALSDLDTAVQNLKSGDKPSVQTNLSAVISDLETCVDTFAEANAKLPYEKMINLLEQMTSNSLALAAKLP